MNLNNPTKSDEPDQQLQTEVDRVYSAIESNEQHPMQTRDSFVQERDFWERLFKLSPFVATQVNRNPSVLTELMERKSAEVDVEVEALAALLRGRAAAAGSLHGFADVRDEDPVRAHARTRGAQVLGRDRALGVLPGGRDPLVDESRHVVASGRSQI